MTGDMMIVAIRIDNTHNEIVLNTGIDKRSRCLRVFARLAPSSTSRFWN
jgi:hypothetical protein